jgi:hypothetical protein
MVSGAAGLAPEERAATDGSQFDDRPAYIVKLAYQNTLRGSIPSSPRSAREISSTTCSPAELPHRRGSPVGRNRRIDREEEVEGHPISRANKRHA